jgi:vacuolar-type H+-ATPase subunit I/STV1
MQPFVRGNQNAPSGILVAFAEVCGKNPIDPEGTILAVHICVSALSAHMSHYPVVVFPPTSFRDRSQLEQVLDFMGDVDVIQLDPFQLPDESEEEDYFQHRMDELNRIVQEYVDLFQKRYTSMAAEQGIEFVSFDPDVDLSEEEDRPLDLRSSLNELEKLLQRKADIDQYTPVIRYIRSHHPELDVWNFEQLVRNSKHEIAELYVKKFLAIAEERYEAAAFYQNRILDAEPGCNA